MQNWQHCLHILFYYRSFYYSSFIVLITLSDLTGRSEDKNQGPE